MVQSNINKSSHCEDFCMQKDEAIQKNKCSWIATLISFARKNVRQKILSSRFTLHSSPRLAFTLAEVLITLGVIGVVAAMTIPALIQNIEDSQYKSAYKKAFSEAQNALNMANKDNLLSGEDVHDYNPVYRENFLIIMDQFKVEKQCINNNNSKCWSSDGEKYYIPQPYPDESCYAFVDSSGRSWSMPTPIGRNLLVDINGFQKPNRWGKDRFMLMVYNEDKTSFNYGIPVKIVAMADSPNTDARLCGSTTGNKCYTEQDYFGTSWLYK